MSWPEDIAGELPNPHPEEPAALRSDILDELHDHLLASLEHEQLVEHDDAAARKSVLSRFGNPSTIARRLWWDAMWGKVMMQRLTLGFVALLCCCAIAATFLIWTAIENSQQATAALVAQVQKLADREIVISLPEQKEEKDDSFKYLEWLPVTVQLKDEEGTPVDDASFTVVLEGQNMSGSVEIDRYSGHPDENGIVDFGLIKPGMRTISVSKPGLAKTNQRSYTFRPGKPVELEITCPRELFQWDEKTLEIQWPKDLHDQDLWVYLWLTATGRYVDGMSWGAVEGQQKSVFVLLNPQGQYYKTELFADENLKTHWTNIIDQPISFELFSYAMTEDREWLIPVIKKHNLHNSREIQDYLEKLKVSLEHEVYADLSKPQDAISLVRSEMAIGGFTILKRQSSDGGEDQAAFDNIVPVNDRDADQYFEFIADSGADDLSAWETDRWVYRPTEEFVNLVRKRLEQIDAEKNPGEEEETEAAEVSAESN